jgi:2-oxo-4-hydroxy-4-carboxy-5-ureidoimidazoline decarboxylase
VELNAAYEARHGFKFVVFVNGRTRAAIVPVLRTCMENDSQSELKRGLGDMIAIARDRLAKLSRSKL